MNVEIGNGSSVLDAAYVKENFSSNDNNLGSTCRFGAGAGGDWMRDREVGLSAFFESCQ